MTAGCLALNSSFEPLTLVPLRRALRLVIDGKAEIVEADNERLVRSARRNFPRPTVIRLTRFIHVPRRFRRQVTNTFLFARDHYTCQYCGRNAMQLRHRESLTRDHVVPLSRGGTNAWTNVVTACSGCNTRKAHHLPDEIGMHLLHAPVEPHFVHLSWAVRRLTPIQAKYIRLFYGVGVLHQIEALEHRGGTHAAPATGKRA
jgi:5-methylcytosine-specific restriction endonuclease McrA